MEDEKKEKQMIVQMNILDYFIFANDPSRESLDKIYETCTKYDLLDWLREVAPSYYQ